MAGEKQNRRCTAWSIGYFTAMRKMRKQARQDVFNELIEWINYVTYVSQTPDGGTECCTMFANAEDMIDSLREYLIAKKILDK